MRINMAIWIIPENIEVPISRRITGHGLLAQEYCRDRSELPEGPGRILTLPRMTAK